jgi:hypothetical protein
LNELKKAISQRSEPLCFTRLASIATTMHCSPKFFGRLIDEFAPGNADLQ